MLAKKSGAKPQPLKLYQVETKLRDPSTIVNDMNRNFNSSLSPDHMKLNANATSNTLKQFREKMKQDQLVVKAGIPKVTDVSYRGDAEISNGLAQISQNLRQKSQIVESSVANFAKNQEQKNQLLGIESSSLPDDIQSIDYVIKERKMLINDLQDRYLTEQDAQQFQTVGALPPQKSSMFSTFKSQQQQIRSSSQNFRQKSQGLLNNQAASREEEQILKKHRRIIEGSPSMTHLTQSSVFSSQQNSVKLGIAGESKAGSQFLQSQMSPTYNIKINTKNYFLQGPSADSKPGTPQNEQFIIPENRKHIGTILGNPSSRKDAETLRQWFQTMLHKVEADSNVNLNDKVDQKLNVYNAAFSEAARQVSVQCINRGELLLELWNGFFTDLQMQIKTLQDAKDSIEKKLQDQLDDQEFFYMEQLKRKNIEIEKQAKYNEQLSKNLADVSKQFSDQQIDCERLRLKCQQLMEKIKGGKYKLMMANVEKEKSKKELVKTIAIIRDRNSAMPNLNLNRVMSDLQGVPLPIQSEIQFMEGDEFSNFQMDPDFDLAKGPTTTKSKPSTRKTSTIEDAPRFPKQPSTLKQSSGKAKDADTDTLELQQKKPCKMTQTFGIAHLINSLSEQESFKMMESKNKPKPSFNIEISSFDEEIDKIIEEEAHFEMSFSKGKSKPIEIQETADFENGTGDNLEDYYNEEAEEDEGTEIGSQSRQQIGIKPSESSETSKKGKKKKGKKSKQSIETGINAKLLALEKATGLKSSFLIGAVKRLKETFKEKEIQFRQLAEENKQLFKMLDLEKAKLSQVLKFHDSDSAQFAEIEHQLEEVSLKLQKEKSKGNYYKDLMEELSVIPEVRELIELTKSDEENDDEFNSETKARRKKRNGQRGFIHQTTKMLSDIPGLNVAANSMGVDEDEGDGDDGADLLLDDENSQDEKEEGEQVSANKLGVKTQQSKHQKILNKRKKIIQSHPGIIFMSRLTRKLHLPRFAKLQCTLKNLLKAINSGYSSLLVIYKKEFSDLKNTYILKQTCVEFMYDLFLRQCGIKNMAEKKFAQTCAGTLKFREKIERVKLFGRFIGLYDPLDKESFKFYMICLNYLLNVSTFGYVVPANDNDEVHYAPFIRVNDFMRAYFENRISAEEYQDLKQQVEGLKMTDFKKNRNTYIVELDKTMSILIDQHLQMLAQKRGHVQDLFMTFDFQHMELIDFQAFYLLMINLEGRRYQYIQIKELFERNSETVAINSVKDAKKYMTLETFISMCFQEKLFTKETQSIFFGFEETHKIEQTLQKVNRFNSKLEQEINMIGLRLQYIHPYFRDLISMIKIRLAAYQGEKLKAKCCQLWVMIRLLQEESIREFLEVQSQRYLGTLDVFAQLRSGKNNIEEERKIFETQFMKSPLVVIPKMNQGNNEFLIQTISKNNFPIAKQDSLASKDSAANKRKRISSVF